MGRSLRSLGEGIHRAIGALLRGALTTMHTLAAHSGCVRSTQARYLPDDDCRTRVTFNCNGEEVRA
jgi:hypothetical protein